MSDQENDYTLLRQFDLGKIAHGASVCDSRGRGLTLDGASEMMEQIGPSALRIAPICWLEGKPVYPDSKLDFGGFTGPASLYSPSRVVFESEKGTLKWPAKKVERSIKVFVDGELVAHEATLTKPGAKLLGASFAFED